MINNKHTRGFTLLETLVAISILMIAVTGPLTIAYKGFTAASIAKDQITAYYLAQDAIEYIRFARDTNRLSGGDWMTSAGGSGGVDLTVCLAPSTCRLDSAGLFPPTPTNCSGACPVLKYNSSVGTYQYTNGSDTIFRRTVSINSISATEVVASTTVSWGGALGVTRSITLLENLFNWP